jgi:hypothetical protein
MSSFERGHHQKYWTLIPFVAAPAFNLGFREQPSIKHESNQKYRILLI